MTEFTQQERSILLTAATDSIAYGLTHYKIMPLQLDQYSAHLQQPRACFVTLRIAGNLRGCIGTLEAYEPLILDVVTNAYKAAFQDPRFAPVISSELERLSLDISVLTKPIPLQVESEAALLRKLRPGIDGLILSDQGHRATFLPSVWEELPEPRDFVSHLKNKAGWPSNYWSNTISIETYTTELIY